MVDPCPSCGELICNTVIECHQRLILRLATRRALDKINANIAAMYTDGRSIADDATTVDRFIASISGVR